MRKIRRYIPLPAMILIFTAVICAIINVIAVCNRGFADFFNLNISPFFRMILAKITGVLPFSLAEIIIILSPVLMILLIIQAVRLIKKDGVKRVRFLFSILAVIAYIYSSFVLTFATAYRGTSLEDKLSISRKEVSAAELQAAARIVLDELNLLSENITYDGEGFSVMPYGFSELNSKMNAAYAGLCEKYSFISELNSRVKSVMLSEPMTYTHISGVYTFFTGEANVNVNYPDYITPYTMAHEMAHQRGIAREDEANFVAFLVCLESDDTYIRYSAYLNMYEYLANALFRADKDAYKELYSDLPVSVIEELIAYSEFYDKYRDSVVSDISDSVNNSYLVSQGQTSGTASYGLVTELAVAYLLGQ